MDIRGGSTYPASALSNFAPHPFVIDGVECSGMEGFLQSLKFDKEHIQVEVCKLIGLGAKRRGSARNKIWRTKQTLWWKGVEYKRDSQEYQTLLDRAYECLFQNSSFRKALKDSEKSTLTHSIGKSKMADTVLTENEFVSRLTKLRSQLG